MTVWPAAPAASARESAWAAPSAVADDPWIPEAALAETPGLAGAAGLGAAWLEAGLEEVWKESAWRMASAPGALVTLRLMAAPSRSPGRSRGLAAFRSAGPATDSWTRERV